MKDEISPEMDAIICKIEEANRAIDEACSPAEHAEALRNLKIARAEYARSHGPIQKQKPEEKA